MDRARPRRADARRNAALLLAAAREVFAEQGTDAPLDEIARRSGVGNATLYRHFPDRRELIIAVYAGEVTALCDRGQALLSEDPPGEALATWLAAFVTHVATKRQLATAIHDDRAGQRADLFSRWHESMRTTVSALLERAQRAGAVRTDVTAADLLALAHATALAGADEDQARRLLRLIRHGIDTRRPG
jgi:AcrR family transcriptional regulator